MTRSTLRCVVVLCGSLLAGASLHAHHSLAGAYALGKEATVKGSFTAFRLVNPHSSLKLDVKNPDGSTTEWVMTTGSANTLANLGFGKGGQNTVKAGDRVTITYFAARNGSPLGFIRTITLPDQREIKISNGSSTD